MFSLPSAITLILFEKTLRMSRGIEVYGIDHGVMNEGRHEMKTRLLVTLIAVSGIRSLGFGYSKGKENEKNSTAMGEYAGLPRATFAGGCFWCVQSDFEKVKGVVKVIAGYTGGHTENPTYEEVSAGGTGHVEAVQVIYDPARVSYEQVLDYFWRHIDPTDPRAVCRQGGSVPQRNLLP